MPPIPPATFRRLLRRLSAAEFASFVADLWAARGWETTVDGRTVIASRAGERLVIACRDRDAAADVPDDVDVVVTRDGADGARRVGADDLREMALYAIDRGTCEALFERYFGRPPIEDAEPSRIAAIARRVLASHPFDAAAIAALLVIVVATVAFGGGFGIEDGDGNPTPAGGDGTVTPLAVTTGTPPTPIARTTPEPAASTALGRGVDAWPTYRGTAARTGVNAGTVGPEGNVTVIAAVPGTYQVRSSPTVVDGSVYFGSGIIGDDSGVVHRVTLDPMRARWHRPIGSAVTSSPAVENETVYVGSVKDSEAADRDFLPEHNLYALNASDGRIRWAFQSAAIDRSSPAVENETVYAIADVGTVYAVRTANGSERWTAPLGAAVTSSPAVENETVYVTTLDGTVHALDAGTGRERWNATVGTPVIATPAVREELVYAAGEDGTVHALDAGTGRERWNATIGEPVRAGPAVTRDAVYVVGLNGTVRAFDAGTGRPRWNATAGEPVHGAPAVAGGTVYAVGLNGTVRAFGAEDGRERWRVPLPEPVRTSPAVVNGAVVVVGADGGIYLLGDR